MDKLLALAELPISSARLHEYFDVWAIEPSRGRVLAEMLRGTQATAWREHAQAWHAARAEQAAAGQDSGGRGFALTAGGIAIVELAGTLMKQVSSLEQGTSTIAARRAVRTAAGDPNVKGIMLLVDSPGGTVSGTADLADDVAAAGLKKPTACYCADLCCSAALWIGVQAQEVSANRTAAIGSIGVYSVVEDLSKAAEQAGVAVYVVSSGKYKGLGVPGTAVNAELLAEIQQRVDGLAGHFTQAVAKGRKMPEAQALELADGRVHDGAKAQTLGLIDRVESFDEALAALERRTGATIKTGGAKAMSEQEGNKGPVAATLEQIEAACPGASSEFVLAQLKGKATTAEASRSYLQVVVAERDAAVAKVATAEERATKAEAKVAALEQPPKGKAKGAHAGLDEKVDPKAEDEGDGDPIAKFDGLVAAKVAGGMKRTEATAAVVRENAELHEAYVAAHNQRIVRRKAS